MARAARHDPLSQFVELMAEFGTGLEETFRIAMRRRRQAAHALRDFAQRGGDFDVGHFRKVRPKIAAREFASRQKAKSPALSLRARRMTSH